MSRGPGYVLKLRPATEEWAAAFSKFIGDLTAIPKPPAKRGDYGNPPPPFTMSDNKITRPPVPGSSAIPDLGSGSGNGGAGGAKNPRQRKRYHPRRTLALATHNIRTLRTDENIVELEEELSKMRWDILGLSEIRREGQDTIILDSGNLLFFREGDRKSQGGVGFLVRKSLVNNVCEVDSVSNRVAYLILRISNRYSLKVIQVYAPTSTHCDDEVEALYEEISKAIHSSETHFTIVMGDFNAKPSRETLRASGIAGRSPATVSAGLRTVSKGSSPPEQNQTRACGASRSARALKNHQTTTDGAQQG
ncbi:hypothetical protein SFRURICE_003939 [Spodoptera frugiperda]|nr:hypothetical protein SFRURICE_003939 [Spodoptera frugiperda]